MTEWMSASAVSIVFRSYQPLAFRPETERRVVAGLCLLAGVLWFVVVPLELVLA